MSTLCKLPSTVLLVLATVFLPAPAPAQDFDEVRIDTVHVRGPVYMLSGKGGNIGVLAGAEGAVLVDDQFAPLSERILAAVNAISRAPARFVINTHWHWDHAGGNEPMAQAGAVIVAHDRVRQRMGVEQFLAVVDRLQAASPPAALPLVTFSRRSSLHLNGERVDIIHVPRAHTDGDAIVHFADSQVIHMGDNFVTGRYPFIDRDSGGTVHGMIGAVQLALGLCRSETKVIPGHGELANCAQLEDFGEVLYKTTNRVRRLMEQGYSLEQIQQQKPTAEFDARYSKGWISPETFVEQVYYSLLAP